MNEIIESKRYIVEGDIDPKVLLDLGLRVSEVVEISNNDPQNTSLDSVDSLVPSEYTPPWL